MFQKTQGGQPGWSGMSERKGKEKLRPEKWGTNCIGPFWPL